MGLVNTFTGIKKMTIKKKATVIAKQIRGTTGIDFVLANKIAKRFVRSGTPAVDVVHDFPSCVRKTDVTEDDGDVTYRAEVFGPKGTLVL